MVSELFCPPGAYLNRQRIVFRTAESSLSLGWCSVLLDYLNRLLDVLDLEWKYAVLEDPEQYLSSKSRISIGFTR